MVKSSSATSGNSTPKATVVSSTQSHIQRTSGEGPRGPHGTLGVFLHLRFVDRTSRVDNIRLRDWGWTPMESWETLLSTLWPRLGLGLHWRLGRLRRFPRLHLALKNPPFPAVHGHTPSTCRARLTTQLLLHGSEVAGQRGPRDTQPLGESRPAGRFVQLVPAPQLTVGPFLDDLTAPHPRLVLPESVVAEASSGATSGLAVTDFGGPVGNRAHALRKVSVLGLREGYDSPPSVHAGQASLWEWSLVVLCDEMKAT